MDRQKIYNLWNVRRRRPYHNRHRIFYVGIWLARSYFSASDKESFRVLRQLKGIASDLGDLVADAKEQGVAGSDELERNVNCWIAAKRYLID
jgi:hypothetical protein